MKKTANLPQKNLGTKEVKKSLSKKPAKVVMQKKDSSIEKAVKKLIKEYGKTLKMLENN